MSQEVHQTKGHQEICDLLVPRVPQVAYVHVEVPQYNIVPAQESVQRLLQFW